eukprot:CAMPEP_0201281768 /NCGR_PEP_ID=MMETSP1317-20130820/3993_1 /ASSEMBLY_ACC=CAM_ASM_000770 /TAXON_ID=187299 /ORGANISM="Undescribed Undescribed, Strain Undescribed" /LENGTH=58 /DNA_ID=CAMNT_0047592563 /DNA_START=348 /DNA_END=524 /DNA_ORIENTATION=-
MKNGFDFQEDKFILYYYAKYGGAWGEIAKLIPGRSENMIKNRFYSYLKKNIARYGIDP